MNIEIVIALITLLGSAIGTFGGIFISSKLTNYRIEQLEKKVEEHNSVVKRTYVLEEKMKVVNHRVEDLEEETKKGSK